LRTLAKDAELASRLVLLGPTSSFFLESERLKARRVLVVEVKAVGHAFDGRPQELGMNTLRRWSRAYRQNVSDREPDDDDPNELGAFIVKRATGQPVLEDDEPEEDEEA
jgi:hypothetical protein